MKRSLLALSASLTFGACATTPPAAEDTDPAAAADDVVAECERAARKAAAEADLFANVTPSTLEASSAAYAGFLDTLATWEDEDSPCKREGAEVTERMAVSQDVSKKLIEAEKSGTSKLIRHLEPNVDMAMEFLKIVFDAGRPPSTEVLDAAHSVDRRYRERLMVKFREHEKYGQMGELETTCIFSKEEIDPTQKEITENFVHIFQGRSEVHALCRSPLAAEKYGGDPDGKLVIILDDDADPNNGIVYEGDLGTAEQWKTSQYFRGRFEVPQGEPAKHDAGYYTVRLKAKRPAMGDEDLASGHFYWHR